MRPLTERDILTVWERGCRQHPVDRALTLLVVGFPEYSWEELCAMSIGQRDLRLLRLREAMFGTRLESTAECPHCKERLEFVLDTRSLATGGASGPIASEYVVEHDRAELRFRLPDSRDLAAVAQLRDPGRARLLLLERCLIQASRGGARLRSGDLSDDMMSVVAASMAENDPQLEILLDLVCPACQAPSPTLFDAVSYLWEEIEAEARRLLREIHTLARAYGWTENEVLDVPPVRRYYYLALVQ